MCLVDLSSLNLIKTLTATHWMDILFVCAKKQKPMHFNSAQFNFPAQ